MTDTVNVKFKGEIAPDKTPEQVLVALAHLFKTEPNKLQHWLSGQDVIIKRDISHDQAQKYLHAMAKVGAIAVLESTAMEPALNQATTASPDWSIAALGSDVLRPDEITTATPVKVDISQYRALDNNELVIETFQPPSVETPDISRFDLKPAGRLVEEEELSPPTPLTPDISGLDILPPGNIDNLPDKRSVQAPDVSHLTIDH